MTQTLAPDAHDAVPRMADDLYADVFLPDETRLVREQARAFARAELEPRAHALNTTPEHREGFPRDLFEAMARAGLYEIPFAADVGGRGLQFPMLAVMTVLEEIAYYSAGIASALYDAQVLLVGQTLQRASPELRGRFLPKLVRGELVGAFATSEPQASTDLSPGSMLTTATKVEGGWRINGRKRWITNAVAADFIVLLCRSGEREQTLLLVETRDNGVIVGDPDLKMGNHAQLTSDIVFEDAFAPDEHVLGAPGAGLRAALSALMLGRIGIGAVGVGMAQAAFDHACVHMRSRKVFGRELASFQHWQFTFAEHAQALESARALYQKAAYRFDAGGTPELEAAMAKVAGSRLAVDVARDAIQVCGASGFAREIRGENAARPLEAIYRDAKIGEIYEGANEIQKWIIARRIFGRGLTG
jgi:butyryl-CoA dehydrogenase